MTSSELTWNGRAHKRAMEAAQIAAVNETVERTSEIARDLAPRDRGTLQDGIGFAPARESGSETSGSVTSAAPHTFLVEAGVHGRPGVHMFRRAADREYPRLHDRIGVEYRRRARRR